MIPHLHHSDPYYNCARPPSRSVSPTRPRSPAYSGYPPSQQPVGPAQPSGGPQRSPRTYHHRDLSHTEAEPGWDQRPPHGEWERETERRCDYPPHLSPSQQSSSYYPHPRSPREPSPPAPSPRVGQHPVRYWDNKPRAAGLPPPHFRPSSPPHGHSHAPGLEPTRSRYDPRQDARDSGDYDEGRGYPVSSEGIRTRNGPPPTIIGPSSSSPESPQMDKSRRRKEREELQAAPQQSHQHPHPPSQAVQPQFPPPPPSFTFAKEGTEEEDQ